MQPIYVFGHKNPDTDSICSAIAYAYLKNLQLGNHLAARLGDLNRETQFVLSAFDVPPPAWLPHIHLRIQDVMTTPVRSTTADATVYEVGMLMHASGVRAIRVVDGEQRPQGVITEQSLARSYLQELQVQSLKDAATELGKIAQTLDGQLLVGSPRCASRGMP